jgi:hypothetical protein
MQWKKLAALSLVVGSFGCATTYNENLQAPVAQKSISETEASQALALVTEGDALFAERLDTAKLRAALAKWEASMAMAPTGELAAKLAKGYYFLADTHLNLAGDIEARDAGYQKGLDWANEGLKLLAPNYVTAKLGGAKHGDAIKKATKEAVPAMHWWAANLGKWAASKGIATRLRYKDDIRATIDHEVTLDEGYFYGAPYRLLGGFEAVSAGIAGGSLEKSEDYFEKGASLAPTYLGTRVLQAELLCTRQQKDANNDGVPDGKANFKKLLDAVIAADANTLDADLIPENTLEQKKAKQLLGQIDDLF